MTETSNNRSVILLTVALLVALLAIAGLVGVTFTRPAQAQDTGVPGMRQVTVVGNGEIKGVPDTANVQLGVETSGDTTQQALAENSTQVAAIMTKLKELGIAEKDIQTSNFSINARYDNEGRQVIGYTINNMVNVTIRNLAQAGALLDQVVQVGANRIYGISFSVNDPSALIVQARDKAIADARAKADQLARGGGAVAGQVLVITENVGSSPVVYPVARMMANTLDAAPQVPVQAGEQSFTAQVQMTFELK